VTTCSGKEFQIRGASLTSDICHCDNVKVGLPPMDLWGVLSVVVTAERRYGPCRPSDDNNNKCYHCIYVCYYLAEFCHSASHVAVVGFCRRIWKKSPKAEGIASIGLDQVVNGQKTKFIRWQVHGDWVQQVGIIQLMQMKVNCRQID